MRIDTPHLFSKIEQEKSVKPFDTKLTFLCDIKSKFSSGDIVLTSSFLFESDLSMRGMHSSKVSDYFSIVAAVVGYYIITALVGW
jgi:hypothetical protein